MSSTLEMTTPAWTRIVLVHGGLEREPAEAWPVEDPLDDERTREEHEQDRPEGRDHGDQCVPQHVARDDGLLLETLATGRAHVILRDHLEHLGAQQAWQVGDAGDRDDGDGTHEVPETIPAEPAIDA